MVVSITIAELSFALAGNLTRMGVNLADAEAVTDADAARLLPVATALVEKFAPAAPPPIQNEAVIPGFRLVESATIGFPILGKFQRAGRGFQHRPQRQRHLPDARQ